MFIALNVYRVEFESMHTIIVWNAVHDIVHNFVVVA